MNRDTLYLDFMVKSELNRTLNELEGILLGISLDNELNDKEVKALLHWCDSHYAKVDYSPYRELIPFIREALSEKILDEEERKSILWFCRHFTSTSEYFDYITSQIQVLHGLMKGIMSDNVLSDDEIFQFDSWIKNASYLAGTYPYDELASLLTDILKDGIISHEERNSLIRFFGDFIPSDTEDKREPGILDNFRIDSLFSDNCEIVISDSLFCFTGLSTDLSRSQIINEIIKSGGKYNNKLQNETDYLIVGEKINPAWAFSCYGRKVEHAISLRKKGKHIKIIPEKSLRKILGI